MYCYICYTCYTMAILLPCMAIWGSVGSLDNSCHPPLNDEHQSTQWELNKAFYDLLRIRDGTGLGDEITSTKRTHIHSGFQTSSDMIYIIDMIRTCPSIVCEFKRCKFHWKSTHHFCIYRKSWKSLRLGLGSTTALFYEHTSKQLVVGIWLC